MSGRQITPDDLENSRQSGGKSRTTSSNGREEIAETRSRSRSRSHSRSVTFSRRRHSYTRSSPPENTEEIEAEGQRSHSRSNKYRHYNSRSRSRSPRHHRYSRSRSRSYTPRRSYTPQYSPRHSSHYGGGDDKGYRYGGKGRNSQRGYNRSPTSDRRRHHGNRDNPEPSRCLGIFGLSLYTQEKELRELFGKYGPIEDIQVVYDAQSGRSRGFAFVYFEDVEDSKMAKERCNEQEVDGRKIRVDYSITKRAHTPTPGIYMGKPTYQKFGQRDGYRDGGNYYRDKGHSPSPYYGKHRYSRSRSRSYSPRKCGYY